MTEPSPESRILADAALSTFAAAYYCIAPTEIERRKRVVLECAKSLDPLLREIIAAHQISVATNPT